MTLTATETLLLQIEDERLPPPVREYKFLSGRKFRFDLSWPREAVAVEIEGGLYTRGRHVRPLGFQRDLEKYNLAVLEGWRVLRVSPDDVQKGRAISFLTRLLVAREKSLKQREHLARARALKSSIPDGFSSARRRREGADTC